MRRPSLRLRTLCLVAATAFAGACGTFDVGNPNSPTLDDLVNNPTRTRLSAAATGIFSDARSDAETLIWQVGSLGREGAKLDGNNQPDYQEPFFGPLSPGGSVGPSFWSGRYAAVRTINTYLAALGKATELDAAELAASRGMAKTMKALSLLYVVETHGPLGAPIDVDRPVTDTAKAPFVSEDSVYGYIAAQLDSAQAELTAAGTTAFPFPVPPGFAGAVGTADFSTPLSFLRFNRALKAKALIYRGTAGTGACAPGCYTQALTALGQSFFDASSGADLRSGAYFDFSNRSGDNTNGLSDPLAGTAFFALDTVLKAAAQTRAGGAYDQRLTDKLIAATISQQTPGFPVIGTQKFAIYLGTGGAADPAAPIPIIRNEELILLRAEANIGLNNLAAALADLNYIRTNSGGLPVSTLTAGSPAASFITELLYNRRYSLLWEQGTWWIDARRYGRLSSIDTDIQGLITGGAVPTVFPIPRQECTSRGLEVPCSPLGS